VSNQLVSVVNDTAALLTGCFIRFRATQQRMSVAYKLKFIISEFKTG